MPLFVCPTDDQVRLAEYGSSDAASKLFRFYKPLARGRNVYRLMDGTFTEIQPTEPETISRLFYGGVKHYVTDAEADQLVAAGYTVLAGEFELDSKYSSDLDGDAVLGSSSGNKG